MAGLPHAVAYPLLEAQDGWAVNFFFEEMPVRTPAGFRFHVTQRTPFGYDLLEFLDPYDNLPSSLTQWDDLPANREGRMGQPDDTGFAPFCTHLFNQYFWPRICNSEMRHFLDPNSSALQHQGFLAVFLEETNMGLFNNGYRRFAVSRDHPVDTRPQITCFKHAYVSDSFRPGSYMMPAGGLAPNDDINSMDGRIEFSFTNDARFHTWFTQVCAVSFGNVLQRRFHIAAHDFTAAAIGGTFPGPAGHPGAPPAFNAMAPGVVRHANGFSSLYGCDGSRIQGFCL